MTYEELCKMLNVKSDKNHKGRHLKSLSMNYDIVEVGKNNYELNGEYDILEKINVRDSDYGKNKMYLEPIIYTILLKNKENMIRMSMPALLELFKMVNKDFKIAKYKSDKFAEKMFGHEIMFFKVETFTEEISDMFRNIVKRIFKDMQDQQLIEVNEIRMYATRYRGTNGKTYTSMHEMSKDTIEDVMERRRIYMKDINKTKWSQLHYLQKVAIDKKISEDLNWCFMYKDYQIILNKHGIEEMIIENNLSEFYENFSEYLSKKILSSTRRNMKLLTKNDLSLCIETFIKSKSDCNNIELDNDCMFDSEE